MLVQKYLEAERGGLSLPEVPRIASIQYNVAAGPLEEVKIDIEKAQIIAAKTLKGKHPHVGPQFQRAVEKAVLVDQRVKDEIKALDLPDEATVVVEPWTYATDGMHDMSKKITMV